MSASYPSAVKVFANRSNGQSIDASHVDDLQDEVSAIEDGILNGTAPLVSSNTRVNNLQVSGGSSFVGNSTFAGSVAISSNLTVGGLFTTPRYTCRLSHSVAQSINSATLTGLSFDTEVADAGSMHSTSVNSSRINFPVAGSYIIGAHVGFGNSTAGSYRQVRIRLNDTSELGVVILPAGTISMGIGHFLSVSALYEVTSTTDYVTLIVAQDSGGSMNLSTGTQNVSFWAARVGA